MGEQQVVYCTYWGCDLIEHQTVRQLSSSCQLGDRGEGVTKLGTES